MKPRKPQSTPASQSKPSRKGPGQGESAQGLAARGRRILAALRGEYPDATTELTHHSAFELLVATILSAQSTDANVNKVMPRLMERYPDVHALAGARAASVEKLIHSTGFFRQKTRSVLGACRRIVDAYDGDVPDSMEELVTLPGVARKTANVVLATWFGKSEGIVVDTHVGRVTHRLGLSPSSKNGKDALRIEQDLMTVLPTESWGFYGDGALLHGRRVCDARQPLCKDCVLRSECCHALASPPPETDP